MPCDQQYVGASAEDSVGYNKDEEHENPVCNKRKHGSTQN